MSTLNWAATDDDDKEYLFAADHASSLSATNGLIDSKDKLIRQKLGQRSKIESTDRMSDKKRIGDSDNE